MSENFPYESLAPALVEMVETADGEQIFCGEWPGDGPTLVFAHGLTAQHRHAAGFAAALRGRMRVIAMDLRGRGLSSKSPAGNYGMHRHGLDVLACMDALDVDHAILAGHSMGAYVATAAAVLAPERCQALALLDGGVFLTQEGVDPQDQAAAVESVIAPMLDRFTARYATPADYVRELSQEPFFEGGWDRVAESSYLNELGHVDGAYAPRGSREACMEDLRDAIANPETAQRLGRVDCPVLAVGAEYGFTRQQPALLGPDHLAWLKDHLSDVEYHCVPDVTHSTQILSAPGATALAEALLGFVERRDLA